MRKDLTQILLSVLAIGGLIIASFWILRPFLPAMIWAVTIVIPTWPIMLWIERKLWGRRSLAVAAMVLLMLVVIVVPFWVAIGTVVKHADTVGAWTSGLRSMRIPAPPEIVASIPLVGERVAQLWNEAATQGWGTLIAQIQPYLGQIAKWLASEAGSLGSLIVQLLLTLVVATVLFAHGEAAFSGAMRFGRRLAGQRGEDSVQLASLAVRAVALGVVVTAVVQALFSALGLFLAGVPFVGGLSLAILLLCIAQVGALPVLVPAVAWLYLSGDNFSGTLLLVWTLVVGMSDNVIRPWLIMKGGADLPLLLIFTGVIGGLITLGLLGIFIGPVVLAVSYTLMAAWVNDPTGHIEVPNVLPVAPSASSASAPDGDDGARRTPGDPA